MSKVLQCKCGFRFKWDRGNDRVFCAKCGTEIGSEPESRAAPVVDHSVLPTANPADRTTLARGGFRHPRLKRILYAALFGGLGLTLILLLVAWIVPWSLLLIVPLLGGLWFFLGRTIYRLLKALGDVLTDKDLPLLGGFLRLVAWDPTEGVVILKHKAIAHVDDDATDGGGVQILVPILGEELALRVPLEVQTLSFHDENILTREYVPLAIKGSIYWRIVDIQKFYMFVSREIHQAWDKNEQHRILKFSAGKEKLEAAEHWLRYLAEEQTRTVVSRQATGLLFAKDLATEVQQGTTVNGASERGADPQASEQDRSATEKLAGLLSDVIGPRVSQYGISLHMVALQEVVMDERIRTAAIEACRSGYRLIEDQRGAAGRKLMLQGEADVLGRENLAMREVVANLPEMTSSVAIASALTGFFENLGKGGKALPPTSSN